MIDEPYVEQQIVKKEVVYARPSIFRRVMANLIDIILFLIIGFGILLGARSIVNNTASHRAQLDIVNKTRLDSSLYVEYNGNIVSVLTYLENSGISTDTRKMVLSRAYIEGKHDEEDDINGFLAYCHGDYGSEELFNTVSDAYDKTRLDAIDALTGKHYFVVDEHGDIIMNPDLETPFVNYYKIYQSFLYNYCEPVLSSAFPLYKAALKSFVIDLLAIELPISCALAGIIVYFVPTIIFWRGHKTLGKLTYKIGVVGSDCLNISFRKNLARFAIFYFAILLLSLVTFALPVLITFSMMVFTKNKQGFQDYMLGLFEIDTTGTKIYRDLEEAKIDQLNTNKKAVDFRRVERE